MYIGRKSTALTGLSLITGVKMTGFKNFLMKWVFRFILTTELAPVLMSAEKSTNLSTPFSHPNIDFYSMMAEDDQPGVNSEVNDYQSWNSTKNHTEDCWNFNASIPEDPQYCMKQQTIICDPSNPYRMMNGSCNNLAHPTWGTAYECYLRYLPAFYKGFDKIRKSTDGTPLPPAREIIVNIFRDVHQPSNVSFMFTTYGQTVAHDLSRADVLDIPVPCCSPEYASHPTCISIQINSSDPFYSQFNKTCLSLHRTHSCSVCKTTKKQQTNAGTAALDASMVYGTNDSRAMYIRAIDGTGKLILNLTEYGELLPTDPDPNIIFCPQKKKKTCFLSGDIRVNQHAILSGISTYYVREHNRIATELKMINPHWEEEKLFQEARRIFIATLQCITYKEYLPLLLGPRIMDECNLTVRNGSDGSKYNPYLRLGVTNVFATAGFRLHSMIPKTVGAMDLSLRSLYLKPEIIRAGHMESIMQGVCKVPSQQYDRYYVEDVTNHFAQRPGKTYGLDLGAIDIQRGRDHGLPPYVVMVRNCSEGQVNILTFDDLVPLLMTDENAELLRQNYQTVEDIDLWVGLQLENHFPESEVGPTAACIIAKQFHTAKFGDRFFFEHEGEVPSFTTAQRNSIKQCSLSRLLCDNSNITHVQKNVMLLPSIKNPEVPCDEIPEIDLSHWTENSPA